MRRILVCGGRDYADRAAVWRELDALKSKVRGDRMTVIQGGANGADLLAREWCYRQPDIRMINEPADWKQHGRAAGPIRNQLMLDEHKPDMVLAFPGGKGTRDMCKRADKAGVPVFYVAVLATPARPDREVAP